MATVFVFPSFGAAVGAPADPADDEAAVAEQDSRVAAEKHSGDDEAA